MVGFILFVFDGLGRVWPYFMWYGIMYTTEHVMLQRLLWFAHPATGSRFDRELWHAESARFSTANPRQAYRQDSSQDLNSLFYLTESRHKYHTAYMQLAQCVDCNAMNTFYPSETWQMVMKTNDVKSTVSFESNPSPKRRNLGCK